MKFYSWLARNLWIRCSAQEFCFKEVQGVSAGMVRIQAEALHEEQLGCAVRSGGVFCSGWHFFLNED